MSGEGCAWDMAEVIRRTGGSRPARDVINRFFADFREVLVMAGLDSRLSGLGSRGECLGGNAVPRDTDCTDARWRGPRTSTDGHRAVDMSCPAFIGEIVMPGQARHDAILMIRAHPWPRSGIRAIRVSWQDGSGQPQVGWAHPPHYGILNRTPVDQVRAWRLYWAAKSRETSLVAPHMNHQQPAQTCPIKHRIRRRPPEPSRTTWRCGPPGRGWRRRSCDRRCAGAP